MENRQRFINQLRDIMKSPMAANKMSFLEVIKQYIDELLVGIKPIIEPQEYTEEEKTIARTNIDAQQKLIPSSGITIAEDGKTISVDDSIGCQTLYYGTMRDEEDFIRLTESDEQEIHNAPIIRKLKSGEIKHIHISVNNEGDIIEFVNTTISDDSIYGGVNIQAQTLHSFLKNIIVSISFTAVPGSVNGIRPENNTFAYEYIVDIRSYDGVIPHPQTMTTSQVSNMRNTFYNAFENGIPINYDVAIDPKYREKITFYQTNGRNSDVIFRCSRFNIGNNTLITHNCVLRTNNSVTWDEKVYSLGGPIFLSDTEFSDNINTDIDVDGKIE